MKPARITFLAFFVIGILGGWSNAWQNSIGVEYLGGNRLQQTIESFFTPAGFIDYFIVPTLAAIYASLVVAGYQKFIKPMVQRRFKVLSIFLVIIFGILVFIFLSALLAILLA